MAGDGGDAYRHAADLHEEWLASGILTEDAAPCLYANEIVLPDGNRRLGLTTLLALEPPDSRVVQPHEETLAEAHPPLLVDVRQGEVERTLAGAVRWPGETWVPPEDTDTVLFDDDGSRALELAGRLQGEGHERVRALFGGLELYAFCLDLEIVGSDTGLRTMPQAG